MHYLLYYIYFSLFLKMQDTYKLIIIASDLNGAAGGNSGTGEIEIKLLDINDNVPTLERESVTTTTSFFSSLSALILSTHNNCWFRCSMRDLSKRTP